MSGTVTLADVGQVSAETTAATAASAAVLDLGNVRTSVDVGVDVSGAADVTVEVSTTGAFAGEERQLDSQSYGAASTALLQYDTAHRYIRVYGSANVNSLEIVGRGV